MYLLDRKRIASYSQTLRHRLESQSHSQPVCWPTKSQNPLRSHQGPSSQSLRTDGDVMKGSIHRGRHGDSKTGTDSPRSHTTKAGGTWVPPLHQDPRHTPLCPNMKSGTGNLWKVSHCHIQKHRVSESHSRCGHDLYKTLATHDYLLTQGPSRKGQSSLVFYKNSTMYQIARAILNGGKNCILCKDAYHACWAATSTAWDTTAAFWVLQHAWSHGICSIPSAGGQEASSSPEDKGSSWQEPVWAASALSPRPVSCLWLFHEQAQGRGPLLQVQPKTGLCYLISCSTWW